MVVQVGTEVQVNISPIGYYAESNIAALVDGTFVATWLRESTYTVVGQIFSADGKPAGTEFKINDPDVPSHFDSGNEAITALSDGGFVVTWRDRFVTSENSLSTVSVHAQKFSSAGIKIGGEFQVNTTTGGHELYSDVAGLPGGGFVVTWTDTSAAVGDTSGMAVRGQVFAADGSPLNGEFLVNSNTAGNQVDSSLAVLADGRFVVTFTDDAIPGLDPSTGITARIFNRDGLTSVAETMVNTTTVGYQHHSAVASLSDGRFAVTWTDLSGSGGDTSGSCVRGQIFHADGSKDRGEFIVNTTVAGNQLSSSIAALPDGHFVVTWTDNSATGGDTSLSAIRAQVFNSDGSKSGDEFLVNSSTVGFQEASSTASSLDGTFMVVWDEQVGVGLGTTHAVRGQFFREPPTHSILRELDPLHLNDIGHSIVATSASEAIQGTGAFDTVDYGASDGRVVVNLSSGYCAGGFAQNDALHNIRNINGTSWNSDILVGNEEANTLAGLAGADTLAGRGGSDTADYSASDGRVVVNLSTSYAAGGHAQNDTLFDIENVIGSQFSNDVLTGNALDNTLAGLAGGDSLFGKDGIDTADYSSSDNRVVIYLDTGYAAGGHAQGDSLAEIENLIGTMFAVDILRGNDAANTLTGLAGADTLDGRGGVDTADYGAADNRVVVNLTTGYAAGSDAQGDILIDIENLIGSEYAGDHLIGSSAANQLAGLSGADTLDGRGDIDTVDYSASDGRVVVNLGTGYAAGGHAQDDVLLSIENIIGTRFASDILIGDASDNALTGGAGGDIFQFEGQFGNDTVTDFINGEDNVLRVVGAGIISSKIDQANGALFTFANGSSILVENNTVEMLLDDIQVLS